MIKKISSLAIFLLGTFYLLTSRLNNDFVPPANVSYGIETNELTFNERSSFYIGFDSPNSKLTDIEEVISSKIIENENIFSIEIINIEFCGFSNGLYVFDYQYEIPFNTNKVIQNVEIELSTTDGDFRYEIGNIEYINKNRNNVNELSVNKIKGIFNENILKGFYLEINNNSKVDVELVEFTNNSLYNLCLSSDNIQGNEMNNSDIVEDNDCNSTKINIGAQELVKIYIPIMFLNDNLSFDYSFELIYKNDSNKIHSLLIENYKFTDLKINNIDSLKEVLL